MVEHISHVTVKNSPDPEWLSPEERDDNLSNEMISDMHRVARILSHCLTGNIEIPQDLDVVDGKAEAYHLVKQLSSHHTVRWSASRVLNHPFLWSPKERLDFICTISEVVDQYRSQVQRYSNVIDNLRNDVLRAYWNWQNNSSGWHGCIDKKIKTDLENRKKNMGGVLTHLLRLIRNVKNHKEELKNSITYIGYTMTDFSGFESKVDLYFSRRSPALVIKIYEATSQVFNTPNHSAHHHLVSEALIRFFQ